MTKEAERFTDGEAVLAHLVEAHHGERARDAVVVALEGGGEARVESAAKRGETWIRCSTRVAPQDEIDPEWALSHNAAMTATSLETANGDCAVVWCFPVACLTSQRVEQLIEEARAERAAIREELGIEDDDEDEDDEDDDDEDEDEDDEDLGDD